MIVGRGNNHRASAARCPLAALSQALPGIWIVGTLLLAGCGDTQLAEEPLPAQAVANDKVVEAIRRVLGDKSKVTVAEAPQEEQIAEQPVADQFAQEMTDESVAEQVAEEEIAAPAAEQVAEKVVEPSSEGFTESEYFAWIPARQAEDEPLAPPAIEEPVAVVSEEEFSEPREVEIAQDAVPTVESVAIAETEAAPAEPVYVTTPFAILLPPQMLADAALDGPANEPELAASKTPAAVQRNELRKPELDGLSDAERRLVEQVIRESPEAATGVLTDARVNEMATASIREANALANRGAQFAAKQKLVEVLRMLSQAKDAHAGDRVHSTALAAGLRALEEAEDFSPRGTQLEGELEVSLIVAAHRTPIARRLKTGEVMPRQMMDLYFRYAQVKLATSVAGEPSGSMALYALGKITSQIGQTESDRDRISHRQAVAFQQAALLAHNQNYFAAHELAVLMTESGRLAEAEHLLKQVAARRPDATVYRNLAHVQQRAGRTQLAANSRAMATQLASTRPVGSGQIRWVGPEMFGSSPVTPAQYAGPAPAAPQGAYNVPRTAMAPPPRAPQQYGPIPPGSWR